MTREHRIDILRSQINYWAGESYNPRLTPEARECIEAKIQGFRDELKELQEGA